MRLNGVRWRIGISVAIFLVTLAIYSPVRDFSFINDDDPDYVTANPHVRDGLTGAGFDWAIRSTEAANWFPLTWLSHMADVQLFGLNAGLHHMTNMLIHAVSAVLLFLFLSHATGFVWRPALVAAIFALHPEHVESVAWISERKDVLCGLFWMMALMSYVWFVEMRGVWRYLLIVLAFAAALMSKPMAVTFPLVTILLDIWPLHRKMSQAVILEKVPLFAMSAAVSMIVVLAQHGGGAVISTELLPLPARLLNALRSYGLYALKMLWPSNLAVFYPFPQQPSVWPAMIAGAAILFITLIVIRERVRRPYLLAGWLWYLVTLLPVIGIVQVGLQAWADRYTYIPMIGLSIVLAWGLGELGAGRFRAAMVAVAAGLVIAWTLVTSSYLPAWKDSASLFQHAVEATDGNYFAYNALGAAMRERGDTAAAIANFRSALAIRPSYAEAQDNLGDSLMRTGHADEAAAHIVEALRLNPSLPAAHVNYASILSGQNHVKEAEEQYRQALQLEPSSAEAHDGLGAILTDSGRYQEALPELMEAIRLKPRDADAHYNLGRLYAATGHLAEATPEFASAVELQPNDAQAHFNLGIALGSQGQLARAADEFRAVIRLSPEDANAHFNLGNALAQTGDCAGAVPEYTAALRLQPDLADARRNLMACRAR